MVLPRKIQIALLAVCLGLWQRHVGLRGRGRRVPGRKRVRRLPYMVLGVRRLADLYVNFTSDRAPMDVISVITLNFRN